MEASSVTERPCDVQELFEFRDVDTARSLCDIVGKLQACGPQLFRIPEEFPPIERVCHALEFDCHLLRQLPDFQVFKSKMWSHNLS